MTFTSTKYPLACSVRLRKTCHDILANKPPTLSDQKKQDIDALIDSALLKIQKEECEEWLRAKIASKPGTKPH